MFKTLEKIQGMKWTISFKSVDEARENQRRVRTPNLSKIYANCRTKAIETGDVDAELAASH